MIENRLRKNIKRLKSFGLSKSTQAYRIYDLDIPEYPFMADIYANNLVVHDRRNLEIDLEKNNLDEFIQALKNIFPDYENLYVKQRRNQERDNKYQKMADRNKTLVIEEEKVKYKVNLTDYIDTGLFLDHRPLRKWVKKESAGKIVLNLFSYTCSISTSAAVGGAAKVTSVDLSGKYLDWGKENFQLNNINDADHSFICGDILELLPQMENHSFDLIICDPPTFSNSKKMKTFLDIQKEHPALIKNCLDKLKPAGKLYFSCNKRDFKMSEELIGQSDLEVFDLTQKSIPADFRGEKIHQCYSFQFK